MAHRCPDTVEIGPGRLQGYRLAFDHVATILPAPGRSAYGALWAISEPDLWDSLDILEGWQPGRKGLYRREVVRVETDEGTVPAATYILNRADREASPSSGYVASIEQGYRDFDLPRGELLRSVTEAHGGTYVPGQEGAEATFMGSPTEVTGGFLPSTKIPMDSGSAAGCTCSDRLENEAACPKSESVVLKASPAGSGESSSPAFRPHPLHKVKIAIARR